MADHTTEDELLLLAWELWGEATRQRILGDYIFAIREVEKKTLWEIS